MILFLAIYAYLVGSVPTAYLLVKIFKKKNVLISGDKNNGAYNTFKVTKDVKVSLAVLLIDVFKGVLLASTYEFFEASIIGLFTAVLFMLLGHNFSLWLRFKGGKGLAALFGFMIITYPNMVIAVILICALMLLVFRNVVKAGLFSIPFIVLSAYLYYPEIALVALCAGFLVSIKDLVKILNKHSV